MTSSGGDGGDGGDSAQYGIDTFSLGGAPIGSYMNIPGNGSKSVNGLPPGIYKLRVRLTDGSYLWYRNAGSLYVATPIRANTGQRTSIKVRVPA